MRHGHKTQSVAGTMLMLLLARLGLRAPEVIAVQLDDIDWRSGTIVIRGKGKRHDRMPLPEDVGKAIVDYIRHGRRGSSRTLFVSSRVPFPPFVDATILNVVLREALESTGLEPPQKYIGSHPMRHSLADQHAAQGRLARRDRRRAPAPLAHRDEHLCPTQHRGIALDRAALASRGRPLMSTLTQRLDDYLVVRRSLGFDLSHSARVLRQFTSFADREGTNHITVDLYLRWKAAYGKADNNTWSARLGMVRVFARWLQALDERTEVPPAGLIAGKQRRGRPYIYSDKEIVAIVMHAATLRSRYQLRGWTCATLFGLIAVTGLRINEALQLDDDDVDLDAGVITVRRSKNGRARFAPITASAIDQLCIYRHERVRLLGGLAGAFFRNDDGHRLSAGTARYNFAVVSQAVGLRELQRFSRNGRGPRIHDLRHTFAVRTIMAWYRDGLDPDREMSKLSTYLGHARPEDTYWYIEAVPELLRLASERAERTMQRDTSKGGRAR